MDDTTLSRHERIRQKQEQRNAERDAALQQKAEQGARRRKMVYLIGGGTLATILILVGIAFALPGKLDSFARCVSEKGAVMYGAIEWCHFTQDQAGMFGKSFKYVNYKDYRDGPGITVTPTWIIGGVAYENVQSLERLSALTGCPL